MQTRIITLIAWACLSGASLFGCSGGDDSSNPGTGGSGGGGGSNGTGGIQSTGCYSGFDYGSYTPGATARTLTTDVVPIFTVSCALAGCHATGSTHPFLGPGNGMTPTSAQIMAIRSELVGVTALEFPSAKLVVAGDPANSWLMLKVDASPSGSISCSCPSNSLTVATLPCGTSMPQGGPQLGADKRGLIRDWIKGGATL